LDALINSFFLVFASEMGDKTQLLALVLVMRYRKPWTIFFGVFVATLLNHALASWAGGWIGSLVSPTILKWSLAFIFFAFAFWILIPDEEGEITGDGRFGPFLTTLVAFFIAEMGDKTQLATIALGAKYANTLLVTLGTTLGMMGSNALAIFLGDKLLKRIPMRSVRIFSCVLFLFFGLAIVIGF
jgi:putative Ca2+/H+ antiporter (TMEM165/GDT1 family)